MIEPDELEPFLPSNTKTIELEDFVNLDQIDPVYFEKPYYIRPHLNPKPYVLLARALESSGKVAIARFVMRGRQYTAAIRPDNSRLIMSTLAYADEIVPAAEVDELNGLDDVTVADREVKMAEMLVESLTAEFEPTSTRVIGRNAAGEEFELPALEADKPKIVDMVAALDASVEAAKAARGRHPTARPAPEAGAKNQPSDPPSRGPAGPPDLRFRLASPVGECRSFP
jgi:DNA end-binding protein Ku